MGHITTRIAAQLSKTLHVKAQYYQDLPAGEAPLQKEFGDLQRTLNRAVDPESAEFRGLLKRLTSY